MEACTDNHPAVNAGPTAASAGPIEVLRRPPPRPQNSTLDHALAQLTGTHGQGRDVHEPEVHVCVTVEH